MKRSADLPADAEGRQYHVGVGPGEVAPYILMTGDIDRAARIASRFDEVGVELSSREYRTYTGVHAGLPVTALATGMGPDNTEMAVIEVCQVVENPVFIRVGSCGALTPDLAIGDLVISTGSARFENTSLAYAPPELPALAHPEAVMALAAAAARVGHTWHVGLTATLPGFYGAQGRNLDDFPTRFAGRPAELARAGVLNMEMEASCLFTLGSVAGLRTGAVCAVYANRVAGEFTGDEAKAKGEEAAIRVGLEALHVLAELEAERKAAGVPLWHPGLRQSGGDTA